MRAGAPPPKAVAGLEASALISWTSKLWGARGIPVPAGDADLVERVAPFRLRPGAVDRGAGVPAAAGGHLLSAGVPRVGGAVLTGADGRSYTIRFPRSQLPPANAFWSLTVYAGAGYLVEKPIGRYNLGGKDELERDADGGVTVLLAASNPHGPDSGNTSNWLPIPPGELTVQFRACWPSEPIVHGGQSWHMSPVRAE